VEKRLRDWGLREEEGGNYEKFLPSYRMGNYRSGILRLRFILRVLGERRGTCGEFSSLGRGLPYGGGEGRTDKNRGVKEPSCLREEKDLRSLFRDKSNPIE